VLNEEPEAVPLKVDEVRLERIDGNSVLVALDEELEDDEVDVLEVGEVTENKLLLEINTSDVELVLGIPDVKLLKKELMLVEDELELGTEVEVSDGAMLVEEVNGLETGVIVLIMGEELGVVADPASSD